MFKRLISSALLAGAAAGLIAALLQFVFVQPVLLHAELYETGELTHFVPVDHGEASGSGHDHGAAAQTPEASGSEAAGSSSHAAHPGIDFARDGLSVLFSLVVYAGYGLFLTAAMALAASRGVEITARQGLIWGVAGFAAVQLAPAFGLSPELPGMSAADVVERQIWWLGTVVATAVGLWLIAFGRNWAFWGLAVALILAPQLIGAPHPDEFFGPTPPELAAQFAGRALGVGLAAWATLGLAAGWLWSREPETALAPQTA
ncbi:CbtA family protein [Neomegalonema sp.]|uniref:CbtA family protein n=1 Tax=Neomegalonema sp. TaxID=2039713 RepID=UPI0026156B62|nr:CbtA family protein [Neomegalonema sp.]MDD2868382.1 CbtA family protein [Neomegalonema sp.]